MKTYYKVGAAIIKNKKLLMVRESGEPHFILPGGRLAANEIAEQALARELREELGVNLVSAIYFKTYETQHFKDKTVLVRMDVYFAQIEGKPKPSGEIAELKWIDSKYGKAKVATINKDFLIPELKKKKLIG